MKARVFVRSNITITDTRLLAKTCGGKNKSGKDDNSDINNREENFRSLR